MYKGLKIRYAQGEPVIKDIHTAHLPELFRGLPKLSPDKCKNGCNKCRTSCPAEAILLTPLRIDLGKCTFCPVCTEVCPEGAIQFTNEYHLTCSRREQLIFSDNLQPGLADERIRKYFGRSLKLRQVSAAGCNGCELELNALGNVNFDLGRYGIEFVASPRHADGIVITGPVSKSMSEALSDTYEAVPAPKIVIACGACAVSGGVFQSSDELDRSFFDKINIDLFVPGCPPHPLTFISGLLNWLGRK
ncbi:MAG: 4Fe-4S binding protein [Ignavibacteria bacterium]